jgi:hypothetical protein
MILLPLINEVFGDSAIPFGHERLCISSWFYHRLVRVYLYRLDFVTTHRFNDIVDTHFILSPDAHFSPFPPTALLFRCYQNTPDIRQLKRDDS